MIVGVMLLKSSIYTIIMKIVKRERQFITLQYFVLHYAYTMPNA